MRRDRYYPPPTSVDAVKRAVSLLCTSAISLTTPGVAEHLFRSRARLQSAIAAGLNDRVFRSDDIEFVVAARGWDECVSFGNFDLYQRRFMKASGKSLCVPSFHGGGSAGSIVEVTRERGTELSGAVPYTGSCRRRRYVVAGPQTYGEHHIYLFWRRCMPGTVGDWLFSYQQVGTITSASGLDWKVPGTQRAAACCCEVHSLLGMDEE